MSATVTADLPFDDGLEVDPCLLWRMVERIRVNGHKELDKTRLTFIAKFASCGCNDP
jgi:hypothetical protein